MSLSYRNKEREATQKANQKNARDLPSVNLSGLFGDRAPRE